MRLTKQSNKNCLSALIVFISFFLWASVSCADTQTYQVKYAKNSKVKTPTLSNIKLLLQLHKHGNSIGRIHVKTNERGYFSIDNTMGKHLIIHVLSIKNQEQQIRCRGISSPKQELILIKCYQ